MSPWYGVVPSCLIPGAGQFFAGKRKRGIKWFIGLLVISFFAAITLAWSGIPWIWPGLTLCVVSWVLYFVMLRDAFLPVPKLRVTTWICVIAVTFMMGIASPRILRLFVRAFYVPTNAMAPTIRGESTPGDKSGDRIIVLRYWFRKPARGDLVAFNTTGIQHVLLPRSQIYVKRVIGIPGDEISFREGKLLNHGLPVTTPASLTRINFVPISGSSYLRHDRDSFQVPPGRYFVIGDNTTNSLDSRYYGPVTTERLIGKATRIYWPPRRIRTLD